MLKRLTALLMMLLMIPTLAKAEIPTLPGTFVLSGLPGNMTFTVYTGPGEAYHVANAGKAKVSTNDAIYCYGRVDDEWLMISYEISGEKNRIGYISLAECPEYMPDCRLLDFAQEQLTVEHAFITDDPFGSEQVIATVSGDITVLAWTLTGGWAYVEGETTEYGTPARGFVQRRKLNTDSITYDLAQRANVQDYVTCTGGYELNLPDDAMAEGMNVYPLADGSYLIAYRCQNSDKLWMRVISATGKKLFAKSVPELYLSQITLTAEGFICETFDNPEIDSGVRYTYTCKGNKWTSKKVSWIEEVDRYYSDNTANFTVRRHVFCEGAVFSITVTSLATGAEAAHRMTSYAYSDQPFLYEMNGHLLLCGGDENGAYTLRIYDDQAQEQYRIPMPEGMPAQSSITSAVHDDASVYFFIGNELDYDGYGTDWQCWRLDRATMTFDPEPLIIAVPTDCALTAIAAAKPYQLVLMETAFTSMLCDVTNTGTLLRLFSLDSKVLWISRTDSGFLLLRQDAVGEFILWHYAVTVE